MKRFQVIYKVEVSGEIYVTANSEDEAVEKVEDMDYDKLFEQATSEEIEVEDILEVPFEREEEE